MNPDEGPQLTPEMIEAGTVEFLRGDLKYDSPEEIAAKIYKAMEAALRAPRITPAMIEMGAQIIADRFQLNISSWSRNLAAEIYAAMFVIGRLNHRKRVDAEAMRLRRDQERQRSKKPRRVAQGLFRDWCDANGLVLEVFLAADLVSRVEGLIVAERALKDAQTNQQINVADIGLTLKSDQKTMDDISADVARRAPPRAMR